MPDAVLLSIPEAAPLLHVSANTLYRWIREGTFECPQAVFRIGGRVYLRDAELRAWLNGAAS